jgi:pyrroline-5-carboxylate reductase
MSPPRIAFVGAGQMATALGAGFVRAGLVAPGDLTAADPVETARRRFSEATGAAALADNLEAVRSADVVFLAVKPQQIDAAAGQLAGNLPGEALVVSIAAGVRLAALAGRLGGAVRLVRVMPNTPCLVGQGACGYSLGPMATEEDARLVERLLGAMGAAYRVDETLLDAVTGLSGSGPAFVYVIIEALSDGGVRAGLPRDVATALAARTVLGAAQMVLSTGEHPGVLKDRVTSPGGTTIAGLKALEAGGLRAALISAVEAAALRSIELGRPPG